MQSPAPHVPPRRPSWLSLEPVVFGTLCGLVSSVGYTAANVCLRAVVDHDPMWVTAMKAVPTVLLVGPWLLVRASKAQNILAPPRVMLALLLAGVLGQFVGNVAFQWALGVVGVALTVPLTLGGMIVTGAVAGRLMLGESVSMRTGLSIVLLVAAVSVLSFGARAAQHSVNSTATVGPLVLLAGVAAGCIAGVAYAVLGVVIRYGVTGQAPLSTTLVTVALAGLLGLGGLSVIRLGPQVIWSATGEDLGMMLLAGIFNAVAFLALTKALQLSSVVYVNALNASQALMAAAAGVIFFQEALSAALGLGLLLTVLGLVCIRGRERDLAASCSATTLQPADAAPEATNEVVAIELATLPLAPDTALEIE